MPRAADRGSHQIAASCASILSRSVNVPLIRAHWAEILRYAPDLNPDELVWSHKRLPQLVRSFFQVPTVAYITDW
jgi:hypothetical protein